VSMQGASRGSYAELRGQLARWAPNATTAGLLGSELFAVTGLLDTEHGLRRALSDPGKPAAEKAAIARALLHGKVSAATEEIVASAAGLRWASTANLADAIERLGIESLVVAAEHEGKADDLEDELFRFGRLVAAQPDLRAALANSNLPSERRVALASALLTGKVGAAALSLISQMVAHPRGRSVNTALDLCAKIAADRRERLIAVVRSAAELTAAQRARLAQALARTYGHDVHLNVVIDPSVVGGLSVQIGDELIDGTAATRLAAVRRGLAA
jgi:F-type H+-transporting ATPase subunit delta